MYVSYQSFLQFISTIVLHYLWKELGKTSVFLEQSHSLRSELYFMHAHILYIPASISYAHISASISYAQISHLST